MNIIAQLTLRQLKLNKKRTMVTIIGVIISVAMVTAVTTLCTSFLNLMIRQHIATNGQWHVRYNDVNLKQLQVIKNDQETKELIITKDHGYAPLPASRNAYKPYLSVTAYNTAGFEQFPIELLQGRLPQAENEVVISEEIATDAKVEYDIGDRITLETGKRLRTEREAAGAELSHTEPLRMENGRVIEKLEIEATKDYTVVGVIRRPSWIPAWIPGYPAIGYLDETALAAGNTADVLTIVGKIDGSLLAHAKQLARQNGIKDVSFNNKLLRYYGVTANDNLRKTLYTLTAIIMAVIVVGSVALIYNAFAISVAERTRYLGMLSSVGATAIQKRNSVFFEGTVIGLFSIPPGVLSGLAGIGITFAAINPAIQEAMGMTEKLRLTVTPWSITAACLISLVTIFISTYLPAKRAARISAIDAIRQTMDFKLTGKTLKTSTLVRRLFGIEAEISLKNLKRNKRRYQATVFSLVISIVLFLTVSYFTANLKKSVELSFDGVNYDIAVYWSESAGTDELLIKNIISLDEVTEYSIIRETNLMTFINEKAAAAELREMAKNDRSILVDGKFPYQVNLKILDNHSLQRYARDLGFDYNRLTDPAQPAGIVIDTVSYFNPASGKHVEVKINTAQAGDRLELYQTDHRTGKEHFFNRLQIAYLTGRPPMGIIPGGLNTLTVIVAENVWQKLGGENEGSPLYLYLQSTNPIKTQHEIENMNENIYVTNLFQIRRQEEQMILLLSVFTYGFIALITAIAIANIFNTISTGIAQRKREFTMLKSVGMTPESFNKMINYESIFCGITALLYAFPLSFMVMYLLYKSLMNSYSFSFELPWLSFLSAAIALFVIVGTAMLYATSKVKKENIIDALKLEMY